MFPRFSVSLDELIQALEKTAHKEVYVWGFNEPTGLETYARSNDIPFYRVEDGFIRGVGLGANHELPSSLVMDSRQLYFNTREESDLEHLLNYHNFTPDEEAEAETLIALLKETAVSKYNFAAQPVDMAEVYGEKDRYRILVVGQVENDASIQFGCEAVRSNEALLATALNDHPNAHIIYKPHPDVLTGKRPALSNPQRYGSKVQYLNELMPLTQAFETVDHVYTLTSLSGLEALLWGKQVTTLGRPFYSGFGLTDDRLPSYRRERTLNLAQLVAGAYLLYPRYFDPNTGEAQTALDVVRSIKVQLMAIANDQTVS